MAEISILVMLAVMDVIVRHQARNILKDGEIITDMKESTRYILYHSMKVNLCNSIISNGRMNIFECQLSYIILI